MAAKVKTDYNRTELVAEFQALTQHSEFSGFAPILEPLLTRLEQEQKPRAESHPLPTPLLFVGEGNELQELSEEELWQEVWAELLSLGVNETKEDSLGRSFAADCIPALRLLAANNTKGLTQHITAGNRIKRLTYTVPTHISGARDTTLPYPVLDWKVTDPEKILIISFGAQPQNDGNQIAFSLSTNTLETP